MMVNAREFAILTLTNEFADHIWGDGELEPLLERQVTAMEQLGPQWTTRDATADSI